MSEPRSFFAHPPQEVAPRLLGAVVTSRVSGLVVSARITEVEAYCDTDPASHTFKGRTPRNATMFGEPGHLYVYFTYGMHYCANTVAHEPGRSGGVLLRAGEIIDGIEHARARRGYPRSDRDLARGPARLAQALGLDRSFDGTDLCVADSAVQVQPAAPGEYAAAVRSGPRVGVSLGADTLWRFWLDGERSVSAYKRSPRAAETPAPAD
ncbi:DNA-3-methyladenine glycosylase [Epidermidibacterium keratini]|uniref:Putative 3-methyladenine DNA glycosylase n=1 Tax=Epidermidibacterium keratini TaxID=1891644 RepID=A0A7L4YJD5_9ACTN|nr:DNA-3-methyladenine glycosylase [Epidermidibacterium keratini]QHB98948.1 DNA-3-methyladenine glycosylase [Epidermidibacterium keratini]